MTAWISDVKRACSDMPALGKKTVTRTNWNGGIHPVNKKCACGSINWIPRILRFKDGKVKAYTYKCFICGIKETEINRQEQAN